MVILRSVALLLATCSGACTVLNNMDGYAGGVKDTGSAAVDSNAPDTGSAPIDTAMPVDTNIEEDTSVADSTKDTATPPDTFVADTGSGDVVTTEVADTAGCGLAFADFGLSEFQVRGTFGMGDKREWIELTNYGATKLDIAGVTVKIVSGGGEKASFSFAPGTMVDGGQAVVIVGDRATFTADVMATYGLGTVYEFGKSDYLVNSAASEVRIFGPGCSTPYETAIIPSKTYTIGQPWAYPPPSSTCPLSSRLMAGGALGSAWKEVPVSTTSYGSYGADAGATTLYGTPTKANNVACP